MDNKREFFRLDVFNIAIEAIIRKERFKGTIRDVSGNGVSFYMYDDIGFVHCELRFALGKEEFTVPASLIRKKREKDGRTFYACTYRELPDKIQAKISSQLLRLDADRFK